MKIVALNSGGFDSVVMLHYLKEKYPDAEIHSLHFNYGQLSEYMELQCATNAAKKLGILLYNIRIPQFMWTNSDFFKLNGFESNEKQELEYRNLVFLSFALSYAVSVGADTIAAAILKSHGYVDTSTEFLKRFNDICALSGIELITPFSDCEKDDLGTYAFLYRITPSDFFSCDNPQDYKPCGECPDCLALKDIMEAAKPKYPEDFLVLNDYNRESEEFTDCIQDTKINEARLYINNDCNLKCKHCYYGYKKTKDKPLSVEEYKMVIKDCVTDLGVSNFHFSGKEPFFDETIFEYAQFIKETFPSVTFDAVTNGVNVPKYVDKIKEAGFSRICLSFDPTANIRSYGPIEAVTELVNREIPVTAFVDLSPGVTFDNVIETFDVLYEKGVRDFYVRCVLPIGSAKRMKKLSEQELVDAFDAISTKCDEAQDAFFTLCIPHLYTDALYKVGKSTLAEVVRGCVDNGSSRCTDNFIMKVQVYCSIYENQITITNDGYVLGCGSETACADYNAISVGNVRYNPLKWLVKSGKEKCLIVNSAIKGKTFHNCYFSRKAIDIKE